MLRMSGIRGDLFLCIDKVSYDKLMTAVTTCDDELSLLLMRTEFL